MTAAVKAEAKNSANPNATAALLAVLELDATNQKIVRHILAMKDADLEGLGNALIKLTQR